MIVQNILITWLAVTGLVFGQTSLDWDGVKSQQVKEVQQSVIDIKVHDFYNLRPDVNGDYHIELNGSNQTLIRLEGTIPSKQGYHRVTWSTDKTYMWSNGMVTDIFKVVNPASYSKEGKVYTMFGPLPEMKGSSVLITATFGSHTDSMIIHLH
tara:strand:- start:21 stop:479 length:459 start_codon:yes stop_codon:yes gene_type:complete